MDCLPFVENGIYESKYTEIWHVPDCYFIIQIFRTSYHLEKLLQRLHKLQVALSEPIVLINGICPPKSPFPCFEKSLPWSPPLGV